MAEKQKWRQPEGNLRLSPPDDFVPESEKTSDWYCNYARWIVSTFYNQSRGAFYLEDVQTLGIAEEVDVAKNDKPRFGRGARTQ